MANVTLPYTLANGNTADGGQVQQNFDAIVTQVNGNIDTTNLANGAVTLAKLATDVKVIEQLYHQEDLGEMVGGVTTLDLPPGTETTIYSQSITLSSTRTLLFSAYVNIGYAPDTNGDAYTFYIKDNTSTLIEQRMTSLAYVSSSTTYYNYPNLFSCFFVKSYAAGSYTFNLTGLLTSAASSNISLYDRSFTIIQFAF